MVKDFAQKFILALNKKSLQKMSKFYNDHCSNLDPEQITFSYTRLREEDNKLASFLNFTRKDHLTMPLENAKITDILSFWGWALYLVPMLFMTTSLVSLVATVLFFYFPNVISWFLRAVLSQDHDIELVSNESIPIEQQEYYRVAKNKISRQSNLFRLFVFKFCMSICMMMCLLFGLGMVINFDTTADCGMTKAALNVLAGKEGNYFSEFGLVSNKSLIHKFRLDLENFEHHEHIKFNTIVDLNPLEKAFMLQKSFVSWHQTLSQKKIKKCAKKTGTYDHPLVTHYEPFVNAEIREEVNQAVAYATHLSEGATELEMLKQNKDEKIKQFLHYSSKLGKEIDAINMEFKSTYDKVETFFSQYYMLLASMALASFSWFIYSFTMLIPTKDNEPALFSKPCGIVFLCLGASLFAIMGSTLFLKSQFLISTCHRSVRLLDHPSLVQKLYGHKDREWAKICLAEGSRGDISLFLKDPKHIQEFKKPMSILRAFSSDLTALNHEVSDYDPPALLKYSVAVEAYQKYELPDDTGDRNGGYTDALETINTYTVRKHDDRYVLSQDSCHKHDTLIDTLEQFHTMRSSESTARLNHCILLNKLNIMDMDTARRYKDLKFSQMI
jgi:hypothetical protein